MRFLPSLLAVFLFAVASHGKVLPVLNNPASASVVVGDADTTIQLDQVFGTEPVDNNVVRFWSNFESGGNPLVLDIALFSSRTPLSRANFLQYVNDGDYDDSLFHRSDPNFIIQGGTFTGDTQTDEILNIPLDPPVPNEFGISNTLGTVAYAKKAGLPDSATSGWFVSVDENTDILDDQSGGFTVFGRVTRSTFSTALIFTNPAIFPIYDLSSEHGSAFDEVPVINSFPGVGIPPVSNLIRFPTVSLVPLSSVDAGESTTLAYAIESQTNPALVTPSIIGNNLNLAYTPGFSGYASVVVIATDSVGNIVRDTIEVSVRDTYARWRAANWSGPDLADDSVSGPGADPNRDGVTNLELFATGGQVSDTPEPSSVVFSTTQTTEGTLFAEFQLPRRRNLPVSLFIEKSTDLMSWAPTPAAIVSTSPIPGTDTSLDRIRALIPVSPPCQYRVRWNLN